FVFLLAVITVHLQGQGINDVLRISQYDYNSTARFSGVSGAFGALGADIGVATINPAGIAEFRKSEFTLGFGAPLSSNTASLAGTSTDNSENGFQLTNLAVVMTSRPRNFNRKTFNVAVTFQQLSSFREEIIYAGATPGTRVERWLELAQGSRVDELGNFEEGPAFDAEAILVNDDEVSYRSDFDANLDAQLDRGETISRSGTLNELGVTIAANERNKFSWGVGLGIPILTFSETKEYTETDGGDVVEFFDALRWTETLDVTGGGVNIKAGVIYKLTPTFRFGASIQSPTFYVISDDYSTSLDYEFTFDGQSSRGTGSSPNFDEPFEYSITTPWRANAGIGYIYKVGEFLGFISGDVEYVDYTAGSIDLALNSDNPTDQLNSDFINAQLDNEATSVLN
ncbi:MAG: hypothetical protein AAFR14_13015, partial [Bacteroidota bacterium]